ncbi:MAG: hypothetical protein AAGA37_05540 [Actinomycetota bacterium]
MLGRDEAAARLASISRGVERIGPDIALSLVYARPSLVERRPAIARVAYAERCISDEQLSELIAAFRSIGSYVELFDGELPFLDALVSGRLSALGRRYNLVHNGIGWGITDGGFQPGRKSLIPALADSYGLVGTSSNAYTSSIALHRFHSFVLLRSLGVQAPEVWHYRPGRGWMGDRVPEGTKVIVKSTYEAWSVGVTEDSVFVVDSSCEARLDSIAASIGQPVTLQRFVTGREVCVPILEVPDVLVMPPIEQVITKAPSDGNAVLTLADNLAAGAVAYVPFEPDEVLGAALANATRIAFEIMQSEFIGRMDFRIDVAGEPWLTDVAIEPGWGRSAAMFRSAEQLGLTYTDFLRVLMAGSLFTKGHAALEPPHDLR